MSRHEGVSCDACMKGSFNGNRFKCLVCYDYDLCSTCYDAGVTSAQHVPQHPMQCIVARNDYDLFYGGEESSKEAYPQSFSCPLCGSMGFTDLTLHDHVATEHPEEAVEVVCPICAAAPAGDPNHVTDNFMAHLLLEHRTSDQAIEEVQLGSIQPSRRFPQAMMRGMGRGRRGENVPYHSAGSSIPLLTPGHDQENMDPVSDLLSQLTNARNRAAAVQNISSQLQLLEMQLQSTRQQLEGLPARHAQTTSRQPTLVVLSNPVTANPANIGSESDMDVNKQFLLARLGETELSESEYEVIDMERADRGIFLQELLLATGVEGLMSDVIDLAPPPPSRNDYSVEKRDLITPSSSSSKVSKTECDNKTVMMPEVTKDCAPRKVASVAHPHLEKMETRVQKTRLLPPPKVLKYRGSREAAPPRK